MTVSPYDQSFYDSQHQRSLQSARVVLGELYRHLQPRQVVDIGCGLGTWLKAATESGAERVLGLDGAYVDVERLYIDRQDFRPTDLSDPTWPQSLDPASRRFDLCMCLEVAEHLPFERAPDLVQALTGLSDVVLFSAATPYQFGTDHINEQWPEFWALLFRGQGYQCLDVLRPVIAGHADVDWWYQQNTLLYVRDGSPAAGAFPESARASARSLGWVHPENLLVNLLDLHRRYRQSALQEEQQDYRATLAAYQGTGVGLPRLASVDRARANPDAADAFPRTRTEIGHPEAEYVQLEAVVRKEVARAAELEAMARREKERADTAESHATLQVSHREAAEERARSAHASWSVALARQTAAEARADELRSSLSRLRTSLADSMQQAEQLKSSLAWHEARRKRKLLDRLGIVRSIRRKLARRSAASAPAPAPVSQAGTPLALLSNESMRRSTSRLRALALFSPQDYLAWHGDVASTGVDPCIHALCHGAFEGRKLLRRERIARVLGELQSGSVPPATTALAVERHPLSTVDVFVSSLGNVFMHEIAEGLVHDLQAHGLTVRLRNELTSPQDRAPVSVYVAPHEFFHLGEGRHWIRDDVLTEAVMYNTEQPQTTWFGRALPFLLASRGTIDIVDQMAQVLSQAGVPAMHYEPASQPHGNWLKPQDQTHPLYRALPLAAWQPADASAPWANRCLDIAFFGSESPHRERFLSRHAARWARRPTVIYYRRANAPIVRGSSEETLTRLAGHVAGHAKIMLNVHREEFGYFEWHRIMRLGMCSGALVVSEPCLPHPTLKPDVHYFEESGRHIPDLIDWLTEDPDGRARAESVRQAALAVAADPLASQARSGALVAFLGQLASTSRA